MQVVITLESINEGDFKRGGGRDDAELKTLIEL